MKTLKIDVSPDVRGEGLRRAAEILKNGGLVVMPTETVYGLGANALDSSAVANIFKAKGRPQDNPLIVHISDLDMMRPLVAEMPEAAAKCAKQFWPGPFTMILPKTDVIPDTVSAGLETVAVRIPSDPIARELIKAAGVPVAAPSANISGMPSPTTAEHCIRDLDGRVDAIIMGGECAVGLESTVVSFACNPPRLLRPGGITAEQLREIIPCLEIDKAVLSELKEGERAASPGMKYKHYSPAAHVIMVEGARGEYISYVNAKKGDGVFALCYEEDTAGLLVPAVVYGGEGDVGAQAEHLFDALRRLDDLECKVCYAHAPQKTGLGLAVYNRLIRAAGFEVISL